jgi:hypothetical protein
MRDTGICKVVLSNMLITLHENVTQFVSLALNSYNNFTVNTTLQKYNKQIIV